MRRFYTPFLILITLSSVMHIADAQDEADWMPDANLRTAVRNELGLTDNKALTHAKMLELQILEATNAQIADLTGLEYAVNMKFLLLNRNNISDLTPLKDMAKLDELRLTRNSVSDVTPLAGLTTLTQLRLALNNITDATPLGSLVNLEMLKIRGNEDITNLHVLSGLPRLNDIDITIPDPPADPNLDPQPPADTDPPGVTLSVPSGVQKGAFDVTITFTEGVSDFEQGDVLITGNADITDWHANADNTVYTVEITPGSSGTLTFSVPDGVAVDAADNRNTAATPQTLTVDVDRPTATISVPSGTQTGAFDATITFTETVSDFEQSDVSLSGSAASITDWRANSDNTLYTATITPTASGTVTVSVAANVATDAAGNPNAVATPQTVSVSVDTEAPSVSISVPSGVQNGAFDTTITFTETVSGFTQSEVSLSGSAASITAWRANSDNTVYTATITPTDSGTVTINVAANVATDAAGNHNTAATPQTVTIEIPPAIPDPATWMPDANLRSVIRSALGLATGATFTQAQLQQLTQLWASESGISDLAGLEHATELTKLSLWANDISNLAPIQGLTKLTYLRLARNNISDVSALSGLIALTSLGVQQNSIVDVAPLATLVNLTWLRLKGNPITDLSPLVTLVNVTDSDVDLPDPDTTPPSVSISVASGVQNEAFDVTITFTETVSGFTQSDLSLTGTAIASIIQCRCCRCDGRCGQREHGSTARNC